MAYEVDILAVGDESKSGDAIALRFGNFLADLSDQRVVVIDGGFRHSGEKLVQRIKQDYGTNHIDIVISTHPDSDHINGLQVILEQLTVGELWMHTPWNISEDVKKIAEDRGFDPLGSSNKLKKSLQAAYDLEQLAIEKGVQIVEPFEGVSRFNKSIYVLGPSLDYYFELAANIDETAKGLSFGSLMAKTKTLISELWHADKLVDPNDDAVNPRNNSSVITLLQIGDTFLFTGDAGVPAITKAADYADGKSYNLASNVHFQHIPHHGSKRNLGPTILNRIIGPILPKDQKTTKIAMISAAPDHPKHPSKRVKNALIRRGANVAETCGTDYYFHSLDLPMRPNWKPMSYVEYCEAYEEE